MSPPGEVALSVIGRVAGLALKLAHVGCSKSGFEAGKPGGGLAIGFHDFSSSKGWRLFRGSEVHRCNDASGKGEDE
jgi:hypothetical protein